MLDTFLRRLVSPKKSKKRPLSLQIATVYKHSPAANDTPNKPRKKLSIEDIHARASAHPAFEQATLEFCHLEKSTIVVGFNKPKKIESYVIVYPEQVYRSEKWYDLTDRAERHGIKIGLFQLRSNSRCVEITQYGQMFYLVDRSELKLRHWSTTSTLIT